MAESATSHIELCTRCHHHIQFRPYTPPYDNRGVLRAFRTPDEKDVRAIENDLHTRDVELAVLAAEIIRANSLLRKLENRHARLNISITLTRQFIDPSPIRRLPSEVLGMIFMYFCRNPHPTEDPNRYGAPVTLAVVCSQWRSILRATPSLWTTIRLGPKKFSPAIAMDQLNLSGNLPLIIHIKGPLDERPSAGNHEETDGYFKDVLTEIFKALPRWKGICLELPVSQLAVFEALLQGAIQNTNPQGHDDHGSPILPILLEAVTLKVPEIYRTRPHLPKIFESAPKLKVFYFSNRDDNPYSGEAIWPSQGIPWEQIEELTLENTDLCVLHEIPKKFYGDGKEPRLELYSRHPPSYHPHWRHPTIVVNKITSLVLAPGYWNSKLAKYLEEISVPTLEDVEVGCALHPEEVWRTTPDGLNNIGGRNILSALLTTIVRSDCMLKAFTFSVSRTAPDTPFDDSFERAIIALLWQTPDLKTLKIRETMERGPSLLSDPEFFALCSASEMSAFLPKLESLELVWGADRQPPADLVPMLQSRMTGSALESVVLGIRDRGCFQPHVLDCMRQLRENGIRATLW